MNDRTHVLLIAETCNPQWSSVALVAYYWYSALCKYADVTLVTQIRNRPGFVDAGVDTRNVVFLDSEPVAARLHKLGRMLTLGHPTALGTRTLLHWPAYLYFERLLWAKFRRDIQQRRYDCVHRITPLSPVFPSPIAKRLPVPFILGPLNGALPWPRKTWRMQWREGEVLGPLRQAYRLLPYVRSTYERADLILTASKYVEDELPRRARARCVRQPENGVDIHRFAPLDRRSPGMVDPFTILFVGRLIPLKNPALIIEAVRRWGIEPHRVRVVFVGHGPEEQRLRQMVQHTPWEVRTEFRGWLPHDALPDLYRECSLLALPSIHESGGAVLLEAMACGLPSVVAHYGGPAEYISDNVGVRVPLGSLNAMVDGFAATFRRLHQDRASLDRLSTACVRRARERWAWDGHARRLVSLYNTLLKR